MNLDLNLLLMFKTILIDLYIKSKRVRHLLDHLVQKMFLGFMQRPRQSNKWTNLQTVFSNYFKPNIVIIDNQYY